MAGRAGASEAGPAMPDLAGVDEALEWKVGID